ncbi:hypothetical protein GCM10009118_24010 [Wandonia haliotis]|uniref:Uncharacterized protein n=1 Tax=Wandonia haliotis TaxID=574963 RepID=A0ABN1MST1_9FLAO
MNVFRKMLLSLLLISGSAMGNSTYCQGLDNSGIMLYQGKKVCKLNKYLTDNNLDFKRCVLTVHGGRDVLGVSVYLNKHLLIIRFKKSFLVTDKKVLNDVNNNCLSSKYIRKSKIESIEILDWEE